MHRDLYQLGSPVYTALMLIGIVGGLVYWVKLGKRDQRLPLIYLVGLLGGFVGAKLAFLFSEGWLYVGHEKRWLIWLSGKSIMGAFPGGWLAVECAKRVTGYRHATGDAFALTLPLPLLLGRCGCLHAGCCSGHHGWPAVPVEMAFLVAMAGVLLLLRWRGWLKGQHFHLFLICYGVFRFTHEFQRATAKVFGGFSGYQIIALATATVAAIAWKKRAETLQRPPSM